MGFQYVIVDAPPLLGIADSVVLGNQMQNILFVVQASRTRRSQIKDALRRLRLGGLHTHDYESYYGYYGVEPNRRESAMSDGAA